VASMWLNVVGCVRIESWVRINRVCLEKLQCLKNWVRHGAVKLGATAGDRDELEWEVGSGST
jgi:hypothetical protein